MRAHYSCHSARMVACLLCVSYSFCMMIIWALDVWVKAQFIRKGFGRCHLVYLRDFVGQKWYWFQRRRTLKEPKPGDVLEKLVRVYRHAHACTCTHVFMHTEAHITGEWRYFSDFEITRQIHYGLKKSAPERKINFREIRIKSSRRKTNYRVINENKQWAFTK